MKFYTAVLLFLVVEPTFLYSSSLSPGFCPNQRNGGSTSFPLLGQLAKYAYFLYYLIVCKCELVKFTGRSAVEVLGRM